MDKPEHYRYSDVLNEGGLYIVEHAFRVLRATDQGYWVQATNGYAPPLTEVEIDCRIKKATRSYNVRWVSMTSTRRYCYPSKQEAMHAYRCRKEAQIRLAEFSLAKAKFGMQAADMLLSVGDVLPRCKHTGAIEVGMPPEFAEVHWYV